MNRPRRYLVCILSLQAVAICGCADAPEKGGATEQGLKPIKVSREIQTFNPADLPELGIDQPPLDGGRLIVRGPIGWRRLPRDKGRLIGFHVTEASPYPAIVVQVGKTDWTEPLNDGNAVEYAHRVLDELKERMNRPKKSIIGDMQPVMVGDKYVGVLFVLRATGKFGSMVRVILITVVNGRRYRIELQALEATMEHFRPYAFAVAGGLDFREVTVPEENEESVEIVDP